MKGKKEKSKDKKSVKFRLIRGILLEKSLRIPKAILEQNAGKECTDQESANYVGVKYNRGPYPVEINSAIKFGLLERPTPGKIKLTEIARKILKPQESNDRLSGLREAVLKAPVISEIVFHYRGENLPDSGFFDNALTDKFKIPADKLSEFKTILLESLKTAELIADHDGKLRVNDIWQIRRRMKKRKRHLRNLKELLRSKAATHVLLLYGLLLTP